MRPPGHVSSEYGVGGGEFFWRGLRPWTVKLTTHIRLMPECRICGCLLQRPLYALMASFLGTEIKFI
jgi:hypothetical protein